MDAYAHQSVPFDQIVEQLQPKRSLSHSPLFQVMLVLQNNQQASLDIPGLSMNVVEQDTGIAKFDLNVSVVLRKNAEDKLDGLSFTWGYNRDIFKAETIARMAEDFERLLGALVREPQHKVLSVDMLSEAQRRQQLDLFTAPAMDYPQHQCIHQLFEQQAAQTPDAIAVAMYEEGEGVAEQLSYRELDSQANQLAAHLTGQHTITPDTLVGICIERSVAMVVSILAVLKAGGAYVPLDPDNPQARLDAMIADAKLAVVLTGDPIKQCSTPDAVPRSSAVSPGDLAYVIYTSGSTGQPKGVMIEHRQAVMHLSRQRQQLAIGPDEVFVLLANSIFDASVEQLFLPLISGAKLVLPTKETVKAPEQLKQLLVDAQVTHLHATPAYLAVLEDLPAGHAVRRVMSGGDVLSQTLRQRFGGQLINRYGPTETTITCGSAHEQRRW